MSLSFWEQHVFILCALVIFFPPEIMMFLFYKEIDPKVFYGVEAFHQVSLSNYFKILLDKCFKIILGVTTNIFHESRVEWCPSFYVENKGCFLTSFTTDLLT